MFYFSSFSIRSDIRPLPIQRRFLHVITDEIDRDVENIVLPSGLDRVKQNEFRKILFRLNFLLFFLFRLRLSAV